jgi:hypothetical protein
MGIDINRLAHFITRVKTTPLSSTDVAQIRDWVLCAHDEAGKFDGERGVLADQRTRNVPEEVLPFFNPALRSIDRLRFPRQRRFARCALLRVGQWALDCKLDMPSTDQLWQRLELEV